MTTRFVRLLFVIVGMVALSGCNAAAPRPVPTAVPPSAAGPVVTAEDAVARVVIEEPRFTGIAARDPILIGQSSWYEVKPASGVGAFIVTMRIGWGDCEAGCIDEHTFTYAVGPSGSVALQSDAGSPIPDDAWPSPGSGEVAPDTGIHVTAVAGPTCPVEKVPPDPACARIRSEARRYSSPTRMETIRTR